MTLSEEAKQKIKDEYKEWEEHQYAGKSKSERQEMGQFFTPPELTIQMIEKFEDLEGTILDPTCGCGGLLVACILAGADPKKIYGIEASLRKSENGEYPICTEYELLREE